MTVYLVGAGPGDPELLTVKAMRLLQTADVVVHDRLVSDEILDMCPPWAEFIDVGKDPNGRSVLQEDINDVLIDRGGRFGIVVRVKGGDPFVFGRGGEELAALAEAGLDGEIVPGITSAIAGPAMANIPVTHRGVSSAFTVLTAHQDPSAANSLDWDAAVRLGTTLVIMMGAARASLVRDRLLAAGADPDTPVGIIINASTPNQRTRNLSLHELDVEPVPNPAVIVVGDVADHALTGIAAPTNYRPSPNQGLSYPLTNQGVAPQ